MLSRKEFNKIMQEIIDITEKQDKVNNILRNVSDFLSIDMTLQVPLVVQLLEKIMNDEGEDIQYWMYELEFGKEYKDGMVLDKDNNIIKMGTIDDLYDLLTKK